MSNDTSPVTDNNPAPAKIDVDAANPRDIFLNRELTWIAFNERVLYESMRKENPLLERLKFIAIASGNLDEFFMKRIGGLKQQVGAKMGDLSPDGRSAQEQIDECYSAIHALNEKMDKSWRQLQSELRKETLKSSNITNSRRPNRHNCVNTLSPMFTR